MEFRMPTAYYLKKKILNNWFKTFNATVLSELCEDRRERGTELGITWERENELFCDFC